MAVESKDNYYTKIEADDGFISSNLGSENAGKVLGIDSTGEVVPVNASGIVTPEGEASVLDNSQPKNLFGVTTEQIVVPTENMLNDESEHCGYASSQGTTGPFLINFNQTVVRNKQLASVSCCIKTLSTADDTYPFFIIDLGTNTFPESASALASIVPASNWRTTYKKFFEVTLTSSDLGHMENFKLDGSDPRVTYRNSDYLDSEGYLVIPTGSWAIFGDDRSGYGAIGYDNSSHAQTDYKQPFYYLSSTSYAQSSGNLGISFFERTWETETITTQNFDEYLVTEESGEQVIHSDIIATALSDIEDLKERNPDSPLKGKYLSIIGDSISTFQGWSNVAPGSTSAAVYYPQTWLSRVEQTYWHKLITRTGMNLLVNNSWSGSECAGPATSSSAVVSQSNDRCHQLHKTIDGKVVNPDYILINIGTNDFDHDFELGTWNGRGVLFPANPTTNSPTTFREAYAVMLYRLRQYYPLAKVYCCTIPCGNNEGGEGLNEINGTGYTLSEWNDAIREVATAFGARVIELATSGMDYYTLATLYGDGRVHPSEEGMERFYEIIRPAMENEDTTNVSAQRLSKLMTGSIPTVSLSTATDITTLVNDYNILLATLQSRGVIIASSGPATTLMVNNVEHTISTIGGLELTDSKTINSGGSENWALQTTGTGRVCAATQVVKVPDGSTTVTWNPSSDLSTTFPDIAFSVFELTATGDKNTAGVMADSWKTANLTLDSNTKYLKFCFKLSSSSVTTTSEQKAALLAALSFS